MNNKFDAVAACVERTEPAGASRAAIARGIPREIIASLATVAQGQAEFDLPA
jgi:hypothetical protein